MYLHCTRFCPAPAANIVATFLLRFCLFAQQKQKTSSGGAITLLLPSLRFSYSPFFSFFFFFLSLCSIFLLLGFLFGFGFRFAFLVAVVALRNFNVKLLQ